MIQDTLRLSRRLQELGFDQKQAEGLVSALAEELAECVATKHDLDVAVRDLKIWTGLIAATATGITLAGVALIR